MMPLVLILVLVLALRFGLLAFALYAFLLVLVSSRYVTQAWISQMAVRREASRDLVEIGDSVAIIVTLTNRGRWPIGWILAEDLISRHAMLFVPPTLKVSGSRLLFAMLRSGESRRIMYQVTCNRRGYFQLGPTVLETGDFFGLHRRFRVAADPLFLTVLPKIIPLEGYDISSRRPIGEVLVTDRRFEDPTRHAGIRRYEAGDPLSRVHWRATARTGELQCKLYEPSTVAGATLLLDLHVATNPANHEPIRSDLAVTAAASITHAIYEMHQQIGLVTNGRDAADRIRLEGQNPQATSREATRDAASMSDRNERLRPVVVPTSQGVATRTQIVETLARLERTDGMTLAELVLEAAHRLPRDATVIVIAQQVDEQATIALGSLVRRGLAVKVLINTFEPSDFADAAGRLLSVGIGATHLADESSIASICRRIVREGVC